MNESIVELLSPEHCFAMLYFENGPILENNGGNVKTASDVTTLHGLQEKLILVTHM